jgi:uncharacterized membrane protein
MDNSNREVTRVISVVTEIIHRPVMDMLQVWDEIEKVGGGLSWVDKVKVLDEVCMRYGVK